MPPVNWCWVNKGFLCCMWIRTSHEKGNDGARCKIHNTQVNVQSHPLCLIIIKQYSHKHCHPEYFTEELYLSTQMSWICKPDITLSISAFSDIVHVMSHWTCVKRATAAEKPPALLTQVSTLSQTNRRCERATELTRVKKKILSSSASGSLEGLSGGTGETPEKVLR